MSEGVFMDMRLIEQLEARIAALEGLLREGEQRFGSLRMAAGDAKIVDDWQRRARALLDTEATK